MKLCLNLLLLVAFAMLTIARAEAEVYISGHADLGVGFENNNLHLHLHAEDTLGLFGGGTRPAGEYDPDEVMIGVPGTFIARPAGSTWSFLASNAGEPVWFLPQSSDSNKPFIGLGTEELSSADGWTTPLTWSVNSITTISGAASEFAIWQNDALGTPTVFASSLVPTTNALGANSWAQNAFSHDHFNIGFTGEGVYDVSLSIRGTNATLNQTFSDTASFRFVTGAAIATVPEPSSFGLLGMFAASLGLVRNRRCRGDVCASKL